MQLSRSTIGELSKKKQIFINISRFLYKHLVNKTFAKKLISNIGKNAKTALTFFYFITVQKIGPRSMYLLISDILIYLLFLLL